MNRRSKRPIEEEVFVCLDCESTGLDPTKDRLIEVAVAKFTLSDILDQKETLVNPECEIPETSIKIHRITPEMVANKPKAKEILSEYLDFIGRHIIVGHSVGFDIQLISETAKREGIPCSLMENRSIDTVRMGRIYGESPSNSLENLRQHFNIEDEGAHRAMSDVLVNIDVFRYLAKKYRSSKEIIDVLKKPILLKFMPLGPHKGRLIKEVPIEYLKWMNHKNFDEDMLYTIRTELRRRSEGNQFGQAANPFLTLE